METYRTKKGDILDNILWRHFGFDMGAEKTKAIGLFPQYAEELPNGYIEEAYALNPILALMPAILPEGIKIILPSKPATTINAAPQSAWGV